MEGKNNSGCRILTFVTGGVVLMFLTALITGLITKSMWEGSCNQKLELPKKAEWDLVNRLEIPERNLVVSRLAYTNRCYIMPAGVGAVNGEGRPLVIMDEPLGFDVIEHVAGSDAASFCQGYSTYMVREFKPEELTQQDGRIKRDGYAAGASMPSGSAAAPAAGGAAPAAAAPAGAAPAGGAAAAPAAGGAQTNNALLSTAELAAKVPVLTGQQVVGDGPFGGAAQTSNIVVNIPMEQRTPRCHKILLDCTTMVGQVQSCFTWQNGRIWMDRQCQDANKFVIRMTKPPGRILKVAQQESIECLRRHKDGKDC